MNIGTRFALVLIAGCAISMTASAQKVYKCGSSYSQVPCPDGETLEPADTRTPAQKTDAQRIQKMQSREADNLEKLRLKDEANTRTADTARRKAAEKQAKTTQAEEVARTKAKAKAKQEADEPVVLSPPSSKPKAHKKPKEPDFFTARKAADAKN
jgi:uncharacterized protein YdaU (DUF1376 family)